MHAVRCKSEYLLYVQKFFYNMFRPEYVIVTWYRKTKKIVLRWKKANLSVLNLRDSIKFITPKIALEMGRACGAYGLGEGGV